MILTILVDSRHSASAHIIGFELPDDAPQNTIAAGSPKAPLLAHVLINTDTNIICVMPAGCQDTAGYARWRGRGIITAPCQWEWQHDHYAITGINAFANRLYKHMGWNRDLSYIIPAIPTPAECAFPNLDAENGVIASWNPEPLFFSLNAAISPDASLCTATDLCPDNLLVEV